MSASLDNTLGAALKVRKKQRLLRVRQVYDGPQGAELTIAGRRYVNFCSNDYLGLARDPALTQALSDGAARFGVGSGASPLVCGHNSAHQALEAELATFTGRERALVFSTGYMANLGVVSTLAGRGDWVVEDRLNHASLIDAAILSRARLRRYPHVDVAALERILAQSASQNKLVLTDGVFSMDGDRAPLAAIARICARHGAWLMVDDAHGMGVLGKTGAGSLEVVGLGMEAVPILMGTFGKAFGVFGAFVAGSHVLIESLIQVARSYVYTTALPPALAETIRVSLRLVRAGSERRKHLSALIGRFTTKAAERGLPLTGSDTPIQPLILGEASKAVAVSEALKAHGILIVPIRPPTVPKGTARLRVTLSAAHSEDQVDHLVDALAAVL